MGEFSQQLWQCEHEVAPMTYTRAVEPLCTISFRVKKRWEDLMDLVDVNGNKVKGKKKLEYALVMIPSGSSVDFAVMIDGERQGSQTVNIKFDRGD